MMADDSSSGELWGNARRRSYPERVSERDRGRERKHSVGNPRSHQEAPALQEPKQSMSHQAERRAVAGWLIIHLCRSESGLYVREYIMAAGTIRDEPASQASTIDRIKGNGCVTF